MLSQLPPKTDTVMVDRNIDLRQIAAVLNLDIEMIRSLNPMYRRDMVPGLTTPSPIRLLPNDITRFIDLQDSICNYNAKDYLAKRDEVKVDDIPTYVSKRSRNSRTSRNARRGSSRSKTVTVRKGDNLGAIAKRNGVSVKQLQRLNGIRGTNIRAGQKIRVK
jgi:membrane-bound lytic murein transglycosylase D